MEGICLEPMLDDRSVRMYGDELLKCDGDNMHESIVIYRHGGSW